MKTAMLLPNGRKSQENNKNAFVCALFADPGAGLGDGGGRPRH